MAYDRDPLSETFNEEVLLGYQLLSVSEDLLFKDFVQDYIDNEEEPPVSPYSLHTSDIKNAVNNHNYTIDYDYGWYDASVDEDGERTRGSKLSSNPFVSDLSKEGEYINEFLNATGEFNVYVGTEKTFSDVPHKDGYGLAKNPGDGNAYDYYGNLSDGYYAKNNTGAPLYDEDYDFIYESPRIVQIVQEKNSGCTFNLAEASLIANGFNILKTDLPSEGTMYPFTAYDGIPVVVFGSENFTKEDSGALEKMILSGTKAFIACQPYTVDLRNGWEISGIDGTLNFSRMLFWVSAFNSTPVFCVNKSGV